MLLVLCFSLFLGAYALPPPPYLIPCSVTGDFEKCALKTAETFIPAFLAGDKKFGIPIIDPLRLQSINIDQGARFGLNLSDVAASGLSKAKLTGLKYNPEKKHMTIYVDIPKLLVNSQYVISGQILVLPVSGNGKFEMDADLLNAIYDFDLTTEEKNGEIYGKIDNARLELKVKTAKIKFYNLFNGDPVLGPELNKFVNEHWEEVYTDLGAAIKEPISVVCRLVLQNYFSRIPLKQLILE